MKTLDNIPVITNNPIPCINRTLIPRFLKLYTILFGEQLGIALKKTNAKNIQEADFELVPPPELGTSN